ncbi:MAG: GGDEF domain-containing protein, partial [Longimicrobiales bacterium]
MPYPIDRGGARVPSGPLVPAFVLGIGRAVGSLPPAAIGAIVAVLLVLVTVLDATTGTELAVSPFYIVPIVIASCWLGVRGALLSVLVAGTGVLLADTLGDSVYAHPATRYWNAVMLTAVFFVVAAIQSALCSALRHERELSRTDALTGVANARYFTELARREQRRARRYRTPLTVAYVDLNDFAAINRMHGVDTGDQVLREVAHAIAASVREIDVVARMGDDEFTILLPQADAAGARIVLGRMEGELEQV